MKKLFTAIIILGTIMVCINWIFGDNTITLLEKVQNQYTGITYYKINLYEYLANIQMNIGDTQVLELKMPTRPWTDITSSIVEEQFWADLGNNLAVMLDYLIMVVNIILYPIRIGGYLVKNILAIIGVNTYTTDETNGLYWLVWFTRNIANTWIPYV